MPVLLDVTDERSIVAAVKTPSQEVDHLDLLINNAGILDEEDRSISISR
jgi:NADP-dependent 3-hydroxy acid dehydrogenase YdfG